MIGAGPGGIAAGRALKLAGIDFTIFERTDGVGGVWRQNVYPGAACDGKSHFYSFSWAINPDWSRAFASQPEILAYLEGIARDSGLLPHLRANTRIVELTWIEDRRVWRLRSDTGEEFEANLVIGAVGLFNEPQLPDIPGIEEFEGTAFHSAYWDRSHRFEGERVAVIGTGASAIQFVPQIAPQTSATYVFQRQPGWILPKDNRPYSSRMRAAFRRIPGVARMHRLHIWFVMERDVQIQVESRMQRKQKAIALKFVEDSVPDPELRAKVLPTYAVGCTRRLLSNEWYPTLQRSNVELVTDRIRQITPKGVVTEDGVEREVDTICYATGFRRGYLRSIAVTGQNGVKLSDRWANGATAHFGLTVPDFPNLFLIYGPYTNGVTPITHVIEAQVRYIMLAVRHLRRRHLSVVQVTEAALSAYDKRIQHALVGSVWASGCGSYFLDADGHVRTQFPYRFYRYWLMTWRLKRRDFVWSS